MNKYKIGFWLTIVTSFFLPFFVVFLVIGLHSTEFVIPIFHFLLYFFFFLTLLVLGAGLFLLQRYKKEKVKMTKGKKIILHLFLGLEIFGGSSFLILLYGPWGRFREFLVTSAMTTMNHKYFATWFYSEEEITTILDANKLVENKEDTNLNLIQIKDDFSPTVYASTYEEQILKKEEGNNIYKIIPIQEKNYEGYLAVIYDPSRIFVATTKYLEQRGEYVMEMASHENALLGINGGGFIDPNYNSSGGSPQGIVIKKGKVITDKKYDMAGGLIGFTNDNKLFLGRVSSKEALKKGVRDAVSFGPFLIVNGKKSFIKGNGGWGSAPRSAIGQRKDGIVLLLVVDGRKLKYPGATMVDLTTIMDRYGAYNAANLDGGTSSAFVLPEHESKKYLTKEELKTHCRKTYCYINDTIDSKGAHATRPVASAFLVK